MTQICNKESSPTNADCCLPLEGLLDPEFFKALGDSRRQSILLRLATAGRSWTVSQVAEDQPIDLSVVSRHLTQLHKAGVLSVERQGRETHYSVRYDAIVRLLRRLADAIEQCCPDGVCNGRQDFLKE